MVYVKHHLPHTFARTLRCNDGAMGDFDMRAWQAMLADFVRPTCRAIADRFERSKDTVSKALRRLERLGYLLRWRVSVGRNAWLHFAVVTDEPFDWETNTELAAELADWTERTVTDFQHKARIEPDEGGHQPPHPRLSPSRPARDDDAFDQVSSRPRTSDPKGSDITIQDSSREGTPPYPPRKRDHVHSQRRIENKIDSILRDRPHLEPFFDEALSILKGVPIPLSPFDQIKGTGVLAEALYRGMSARSVISWLYDDLKAADNPPGALRWRIDQLARRLGRKPVFKRRWLPGSRASRV